MDLQEQQQVSPFLSVLSRLDRLDRWVQLLEERHCSSPVIRKMMKTEDECKSLSSALEEVQDKGTLIERLTLLEKRVLQLSLEMEVGNTSRSSSCSNQIPKKIEDKSDICSVMVKEQGGLEIDKGFSSCDVPIQRELYGEILQQESRLVKTNETKSEVVSQRGRRRRRWVGWFGMGC
ncbi:hypothetical protein ACOSP7_022430 [Xanthoceras sorbifolium]